MDVMSFINEPKSPDFSKRYEVAKDVQILRTRTGCMSMLMEQQGGREWGEAKIIQFESIDLAQ